MNGSSPTCFDLSTPKTLAWFSLGSIALVEIAMRGGADAAVIDLQHGLWDRMSAYQALLAAHGRPVLMRVASMAEADISAGLDTGAAGILVPMVETAEDAAAIVQHSRFAPQGSRSGGGVRPLSAGFADYVASQPSFVGIMIETKAGVANAAAIARVPGVDAIFIGTGDLSLSLGCFPHAGDALDAACAAVLLACREAGLPCGIFTNDRAGAAQRLADGYAMVVIANDISVIANGFGPAGAAQ